MSNLRLINETTITSSQSVTNITDVFTSDFDIYKITLQDLSTVGTLDVDINARLINNSGSVLTASNYDYAVFQLKANATFSENKNTNFSRIDRITFSDQSPEAQGSVIYVYNPFSSSSYTYLNWQSVHMVGGNGGGVKGIAVHKVAETITGINFFDVNTDRPYNSGTIRTYGLRVDS